MELERLALLDRDSRGITIHDLLRQHARERLGPKSRSLHQQLLRSDGATDYGQVPVDADAYVIFGFHTITFERRGFRSRWPRFGSMDVWGRLREFFRTSSERHPPLKPPHAEDKIVLGREARLAVLGTGTALYGAPAIAQSGPGPGTL